MQKDFLDDNFECIYFHSTGTFSADTEENFNVSNIEQYLRYNSLHTQHTKYWDFHSNWNSEIVQSIHTSNVNEFFIDFGLWHLLNGKYIIAKKSFRLNNFKF